MNATRRPFPSSLLLGFLGTVVVLLLSFLRPAGAAPLADPGTGALVGRDAGGRTVEFPLKHTDVSIEVSGFVARATVTQSFTNPYDRRIEATYVFPLPQDAAVDDMLMTVGKRTIRGTIRERNEARQVYEEARANGQTAALLEQERPNIFTQSVANLLPGDDVKITLTYVQTVKYEAGTLSLAFPMVVGPRYIPGHVTTPAGDAIPVSAEACSTPDADRITPPVLRPGTRSGHDVSIAVRLDAGVPYVNLRSKSHDIDERRVGPDRAEVTLVAGDAIPNQDFELAWDVRPERVEAGLLAHRTGDDGFFTLMLVPSPAPRPADVTPKEMVFVLDCSGSMSGAPIEQAKALVRHALGNLNPDDTFQIMNFSMSASGLATRALSNTPGNVQRGLAYLDTLRGEGGTEMITGIRAALSPERDPERVRVVLFLTDGYIGNEGQILDEVRRTVGDARLYSLGVGTSVNRYLLENLALEGRGQVLYVRPDEDAAAPVARFYDQVRSPVMTGITVDWAGLDVVDPFPAQVPDLFAGHPILVTAKYRGAGEATVRVQGRIGGRRVSIPVQVSLPDRQADNAALPALWARAAIGDAMRLMLQGEIPAIVKKVIDLSVRHRVLSQYTAFVAVEQRARTNERGDPTKVEVPVEMPQDVSFEGVFGDESDGDTIVANLVKPDRGYAEARRAPAKAMAFQSYGAAAPAPSAPPPSAAPMVYGGSFGGGKAGGTVTASGMGMGGGGVAGPGRVTAGIGYGALGAVAGEKKEQAATRTRDNALASVLSVADAAPRARTEREDVQQAPAEPAPAAAPGTLRTLSSKDVDAGSLEAFRVLVQHELRKVKAASGLEARLSVRLDAKGRLRIVSVEGPAPAAVREAVTKALKAAGLLDATAAGPGQAVLAMQF